MARAADTDETLLAFALELAEAAGAEILPRFRQGTAVGNKSGEAFDPVTDADRQAERAMRERIEERYPDHGIIGEEFGVKPSRCGLSWVLDPIDGTRGFICGVPTWATLIGLADGERARIGVMHQPYVAETFYGSAQGAFVRHRGGTDALRVSGCESLQAARAGTTTLEHYRSREEQAFYNTCRSAVQLMRHDGDAYFYALLAAGHVDLALDAFMQPYDIVALIPIIEAAGGVVTTWSGDPALQGGNIVAAASQPLHRAALRLLADAPV